LLEATSGTWKIFTIHIGVQLGFYRALAAASALNSVDLAAKTHTNERYAREWLEQQTVAGILTVEDEKAEAQARRYALPPGHVEPLTQQDSLNFLAPLAQITVGTVYPIAAVIDAYRSGNGVAYEDYGADLREGQAGMNRNAFLHDLGKEWLPAIPDVHSRLQADPAARVADIGCGFGWSSIGMAQHYAKIQVDGYDMDQASVDRAQEILKGYDVRDRVTIHCRDAGDSDMAGQYDLVTAFECVHDMSQPAKVLATMRRLVNDNGAVIIMDERVGDSFTAQGNEIEWLMYGFSVLHCLPVGMAEQPSVGTGTVMRADTLRGYAKEAGFQEVEVLPIDNFFFRFYRLHV
jgi:2-polyprenyl-3-methyl-5-hydroxy-6-metoxy-1,4-benzoquinol methylase